MSGKIKRNGTRHKGKTSGKQKNAGVNAIEIAALNKGEPVGGGLELLRGTKDSQSDGKGNRGANKTRPLAKAWNQCAEQSGNRSAKQNTTAGEGLELVCGTKESQSEEKGNRGAEQNKAAGEGLEPLCGTKGSRLEEKRNLQE